jgi:hypothetical protein
MYKWKYRKIIFCHTKSHDCRRLPVVRAMVFTMTGEEDTININKII